MFDDKKRNVMGDNDADLRPIIACWSSLPTCLVQMVAVTLSVREEQGLRCLDKRTCSDLRTNPMRTQVGVRFRLGSCDQSMNGLFGASMPSETERHDRYPRLKHLTVLLDELSRHCFSLKTFFQRWTPQLEQRRLRSFVLQASHDDVRCGGSSELSFDRFEWPERASLWPRTLTHLGFVKLKMSGTYAPPVDVLQHLVRLQTLDVRTLFVDCIRLPYAMSNSSAVFSEIKTNLKQYVYSLQSYAHALVQRPINVDSFTLQFVEENGVQTFVIVKTVSDYWSVADMLRFRFSDVARKEFGDSLCPDVLTLGALDEGLMNIKLL
jgi:hypothetical protein